MAEGSDALLEQLDRVMRDEFGAGMLGRVGRGRLTDVNFLKRNSTLAWSRDVLQLEWRNTIRHRTGSVARTHEHRGRRRLVEALSMLWNRWRLFRPLFPLGGGIDPVK